MVSLSLCARIDLRECIFLAGHASWNMRNMLGPKLSWWNFMWVVGYCTLLAHSICSVFGMWGGDACLAFVGGFKYFLNFNTEDDVVSNSSRASFFTWGTTCQIYGRCLQFFWMVIRFCPWEHRRGWVWHHQAPELCGLHLLTVIRQELAFWDFVATWWECAATSKGAIDRCRWNVQRMAKRDESIGKWCKCQLPKVSLLTIIVHCEQSLRVKLCVNQLF